VLAVDATSWLRPDAETSPERLFCHVYGRTRETDQFLPGWPYQLVAALESGPTSWTALLDARRLSPAEDATAVTAQQLRAVVERLRAAGHWQPADPPMLVVLDAGYDVCRLGRPDGRSVNSTAINGPASQVDIAPAWISPPESDRGHH
jgi:hypothetical protein